MSARVTGLARVSAGVLPLVLPLLLGGCAATAPFGAPASSEVARAPARVQAAAISPAAAPRDYASACGPCHDRGGFGVRVLADRLGQAQSLLHVRTALPPEAIRLIVRRGLGAMPAMSRVEVSDAELERILVHLGGTAAAGGAP